MKITLNLQKPRNPVAVPARQRKAGAHGPSRSARQADRLALQRELATALDHRRSP